MRCTAPAFIIPFVVYVLVEAMLPLLIVIFERSGSTFLFWQPSPTTVLRAAKLGVPLDSDRQYSRAVYITHEGVKYRVLDFRRSG